VGHVGDSRGYLLRDGALSQITADHTFVQSLIDEGRITEDEATTHPQRSLLLKALTGHEVEPSLTVREARAGDRYLLCSDGLSGPVSFETMTEAVEIPDPQACADRMIELALKGGGPDNVTVIIADVIDVDYGDNNPIVGGAAGNGSDEMSPPDSPASRAATITAPRQQPRVEAPPEPPDPRIKRRKRIRLIMATLVALLLLAAGAVAAKLWVNNQYFVGEGANGEIAIFQGVRGSVLGLSLNSQREGSCDPAAATTCDKFYVSDLEQFGKDEVRSGTLNFDNIVSAREYVRELRSKFGLTDCATMAKQNQTAQETTEPGQPPQAPIEPTQPTESVVAQPTSETAAPSSGKAIPEPGVNCRKPRDEDKGGG
jgi:protein phosphatase